MDGLYVVRTSLAEGEQGAENTVRAYKRLSAVEHAFRSLKTVDLRVRPVFHRIAGRVRAHASLFMLAYYVEWHMRARLGPQLFDDHDPRAAQGFQVLTRPTVLQREAFRLLGVHLERSQLRHTEFLVLSRKSTSSTPKTLELQPSHLAEDNCCGRTGTLRFGLRGTHPSNLNVLATKMFDRNDLRGHKRRNAALSYPRTRYDTAHNVGYSTLSTVDVLSGCQRSQHDTGQQGP